MWTCEIDLVNHRAAGLQQAYLSAWFALISLQFFKLDHVVAIKFCVPSRQIPMETTDMNKCLATDSCLFYDVTGYDLIMNVCPTQEAVMISTLLHKLKEAFIS